MDMPRHIVQKIGDKPIALCSDHSGFDAKETFKEIFKGTADVRCEEDMVVYQWDYKELHSLTLTCPSIGVAVERKISTDLNKKMSDSTNHRINIRAYIAILFKISKNGKILEKHNEMLAKERQKRGLSEEDHQSIMKELGIKYKHVSEAEAKYADACQDILHFVDTGLSIPFLFQVVRALAFRAEVELP